MSEKKETEMNEIDIQAAIAAWIIANDGCGGYNEVSCNGAYGHFKGVDCPVSRFGMCCCLHKHEKLAYLSKWLGKYNQQKADSAKAAGQSVESAKNEEQEKGKTCGSCSHFFDANGEDGKTTQGVALCSKKSIMVPVEFTGCSDFEPIADVDQSNLQGEGEVNASAFVERISQLEKENARIAEEVSGYRGRTRRILELCDVIVICIDQAIKEREELQNQLNTAQEDILRLERRVNEVERENNLSAQRLVDCRSRMSDRCVKNDDLIDQLMKENAELRSMLTLLRRCHLI